MNLPKMILFDYGQTLADEKSFDGIAGTAAVLKYAAKNKYNRTAEEIQAVANAMNHELGRYDPERKYQFQVEVPNDMFNAYLYESQGITLSISAKEVDKIFWDAAAPAVPTEGIKEFLQFLREKGIRTGVISNIVYCGEAVEERIGALLPEHKFEFIVASSEYMYRKPNKRIFEIALEKADLKPEEVWYIGDQYGADVAGARNAGIMPVWYVGATAYGKDTKADVWTVEHWDEIRDCLLSEMD